MEIANDQLAEILYKECAIENKQLVDQVIDFLKVGTVNIGFKYYEPIRLVFVQSDYCYICDKQQIDNINCLTLGRLYGWLYCDDCINTVRLSTIHFINNNNIPLHWLFNSSEYSKKIKFFRKSKNKIQESIMRYFDMDEYDYGCYAIRKYDKLPDNKYGIFLFFNDAETDETMGRAVSLSNIFAHTEGLYEELINSKNIFNDKKIVVRFDELSLNLKNGIHDAYKLACCRDKYSYDK
jgi:hypothetical protein